jgi:hypothetical protein
MKSKPIVVAAVILGTLTARFGLYWARWSYNSVQDPFVFWKVLVEYGSPVVASLIWVWILLAVFKPTSK